MDEAELSTKNGIHFHAWFRIILGVVLSGIVAMNAYAYYFIMPKIVENMIANDKQSRERDDKLQVMLYEDKIAITELKAMNIKLDNLIVDVNEFKQLLQRRIPK